MKYIQRTNSNITDDFLINLLEDRKIIPKDNIDYRRKFFKPTIENFLSLLDLDNMEEGFQLFKKHLENGSRFFIVIDPDMDGFGSASTLFNYMTQYLKPLYPNITINYHVPENKAHGLETIMDIFLEEKICDLILIPDAGSNDFIYHEQLKNLGYDILILDHHMASKYSEHAIVINNQLSQHYENKDLSGAGVVFKFLQYCDNQFNIKGAYDYLDLVAVAECSDMMNLNTLENRVISDYGFSHIKNVGLQALINQQSYSLFGTKETASNFDGISITPEQCAFYIGPLVNALIRVGSSKEKELLFKAFIEGDTLIKSTKRGHLDELETITEQNARNCANARTRQNKEKERISELLDIQITNDCLDDNKILILNSDDLDVPNTMTGLCAMSIVAKYKKPVILGRTCPDGYLKGSIRGVADCELKDFRQFLVDSKLVEKVEGHSQAAGCSIKLKNIDKLTDYANTHLANMDFNEGYYEVDFIVNGNCSYLEDLILELNEGKRFFGQGCPEPVIAINNVVINKNNIQVIGVNQDTLKFTFNGITYLKFKAVKLIDEIKQYNNKISLTIIGRGNVNEWGGNITPQIFIDDIEIKEISNIDF